MNREQEEAVLRITAEYVAEVQAGHAPRLSDYLARYPQHADAITAFVTYYHAVEVDLPAASGVVPPLSERSSTALERAWERIQVPVGTGFIVPSVSDSPLTTLLAIANKRHLSLEKLAVKSGLSLDIIEKLERRMIVASTLPQELLKRFAALLQQPFSVIAAYFGLSDQSQPMSLEDSLGDPTNVGASLARVRVAEARPLYQVEEASDIQSQSFREAIEQSVQLSDEQKAVWKDILSSEGL